jgi:hypothetical protein
VPRPDLWARAPVRTRAGEGGKSAGSSPPPSRTLREVAWRGASSFCRRSGHNPEAKRLPSLRLSCRAARPLHDFPSLPCSHNWMTGERQCSRERVWAVCLCVVCGVCCVLCVLGSQPNNKHNILPCCCCPTNKRTICAFCARWYACHRDMHNPCVNVCVCSHWQTCQHRHSA